ncbi:MAG: hypothetical protein JWQ84_2692 [Mucilaginibacter sp.]|nr:hypothetical protein [Mucilaginibacter sp.]
MKLVPYLSFPGNCEEALNAYQVIFNGEIGQINRYDNPSVKVPEGFKNKIMHTALTFGDNTIMFTDAMPVTSEKDGIVFFDEMPGYKVNYGNGIALSIGLTDIAQTTEIFNKLADNGNITVPLEKQFWGSWFGQVTDRFGISWMLMCEE